MGNSILDKGNIRQTERYDQLFRRVGTFEHDVKVTDSAVLEIYGSEGDKEDVVFLGNVDVSREGRILIHGNARFEGTVSSVPNGILVNGNAVSGLRISKGITVPGKFRNSPKLKRW